LEWFADPHAAARFSAAPIEPPRCQRVGSFAACPLRRLRVPFAPNQQKSSWIPLRRKPREEDAGTTLLRVPVEHSEELT
jgi:hypothetical protein